MWYRVVTSQYGEKQKSIACVMDPFVYDYPRTPEGEEVDICTYNPGNYGWRQDEPDESWLL